MRSLGLAVLLSTLAGCGGASDTATGNGGFDFGAGGGGGGGAGGGSGSCVPMAACDVPGGVGACSKGKTTCSPGGKATCVGGKAAPETCNGVDDDCNGLIDESCELTVTAIGANGVETAKKTTSAFPVGGRASLALSDVLMTDPGNGWARVTSASPLPVGGTFSSAQIAGADPHLLMPTVAPTQGAKSIVVPTYRFGGTTPAWGHTIALANLGAAAANVTFATPGQTPPRPPQKRMIPKGGSLATSVASVFTLDPAIAEQGWLSITSDQPLVAAYEETDSDYADVAGDAGWGAPGKSLTLPYFASGGALDTTLRLATASNTDVMVAVRLHPTADVPLEAMVTVPANGFLATPISTQFPGAFTKATTGWIELVAGADVAAAALVLEAKGGGMALVGAIDALDTLHFVADAAIDVGTGVSTEVLLANPGTSATEVTIAAFGADGSRGAVASVLLGPGGTYDATLASLLGLTTFNGWVRIASDRPVTGAYARRDGAAGLGATALHHGLANTAIVPDVRATADGLATTVTLIQPERRAP